MVVSISSYIADDFFLPFYFVLQETRSEHFQKV